MKQYTREQVYNETLSYFDNDALATKVFIEKYCLKDNEGHFVELTPDDTHIRLAKEFFRIEDSFGGKNKLDFDTIYSWLKGFEFICPQGSVLYGLGNDFCFSSLSNCTVVGGPSDNISSIFDVGRDVANLCKMRCGVGLDLSNLRPEGSPVMNSALTSTGAWSFVKYYSDLIGVIGQNSRRGAGMVTFRIDHPDIIKFLSCKRDISNSNSINISIKVFDSFMEAVLKKEKYTLHWADGNKEHTDSIDASVLWDMITSSAAESAEPGVLFWDAHLRFNPSSGYDNLKVVSTNPCAELPLEDGGACRLISCNVSNLVKNKFTKEAEVDFIKLKEMYEVAVRLGDDLVELELERIKVIIGKAKTENDLSVVKLWEKFYNRGIEGRRVGVGVHGLADLITSCGLRYDSEEGIALVDKLFMSIKEAAYNSSIELAKERGSFLSFDWDKERDNEYILSLPESIQTEMSKFGRRNVCLLACAPTGSVSIESRSSSGIEPVFRNTYTRRRKLNRPSENSDMKVFMSSDGQYFEEFKVDHPLVAEWKKIHNSESLPEYFVESSDIGWRQRIKLQAAIQKHVDNSISSTINLPKGTPNKTVSDIYMEAWKQGLKGVTVYVEGAREGVLVSEELEEFKSHEAIKRPEVLECDIQHMQVQGKKWVVFIGLMDNRPYEVFAGLAKYVELPKKFTKGVIVKRFYKTKNSEYDLIIDNESQDPFVVKNIVEIFENPNHGVLGRLVSLSLRHGTKPAYLSEQLLKDADFDFTTYSKTLGRVLKKYIANGEKPETGSACFVCGSDLVYQEGCKQCLSCGWSKCE